MRHVACSALAKLVLPPASRQSARQRARIVRRRWATPERRWKKLHGERRGSRGHSFHGHALLLWAIDEVERIDDLAELARTIREYYVGQPSLPDLLRRIDDRAGELLSGRPRANVMRVRLEP